MKLQFVLNREIQNSRHLSRWCLKLSLCWCIIICMFVFAFHLHTHEQRKGIFGLSPTLKRLLTVNVITCGKYVDWKYRLWIHYDNIKILKYQTLLNLFI